MTDTKDEIKESKECSCDKTKEAEECPKGQIQKDGKCVPDEAKEQQVEAPKAEAPQVDITKFMSDMQLQLKSLEAKIGVIPKETPKPTAIVSNSGSEPFSLNKSIEKVNSWMKTDRDSTCTLNIPVDFLRGVNTQKVRSASGQMMEVYINQYNQDRKITEALGYTGTQSVPEEDPVVALEPGGFSFVPVTQYAKYKEVKQGNNAAKFFKHDLPAPGTQTVGTAATVATMDIEAITATPSTITGVQLEVDTDDIEDNPYDTMGVVLKAMAARFDDFIATDMLDTKSAEGTLTPLRWIRGDTGATITHSDTATVPMDPTGIAVGRQVLENQGLLQGGVRPVCFLDPQQFREVIEDSEIANYVQFGNPNITKTYTMPELYGVDLVQTNAIEHTD